MAVEVAAITRQAKKDPDSRALVAIEKELEKDPFNVGINEAFCMMSHCA